MTKITCCMALYLLLPFMVVAMKKNMIQEERSSNIMLAMKVLSKKALDSLIRDKVEFDYKSIKNRIHTFLEIFWDDKNYNSEDREFSSTLDLIMEAIIEDSKSSTFGRTIKISDAIGFFLGRTEFQGMYLDAFDIYKKEQADKPLIQQKEQADTLLISQKERVDKLPRHVPESERIHSIEALMPGWDASTLCKHVSVLLEIYKKLYVESSYYAGIKAIAVPKKYKCRKKWRSYADQKRPRIINCFHPGPFLKEGILFVIAKQSNGKEDAYFRTPWGSCVFGYSIKEDDNYIDRLKSCLELTSCNVEIKEPFTRCRRTFTVYQLGHGLPAPTLGVSGLGDEELQLLIDKISGKKRLTK